MDPVFLFGTDEIERGEIQAEENARNQQDTDQETEHILQPETLMAKEHDVADSHRRGKGHERDGSYLHKADGGAAENGIDVEH